MKLKSEIPEIASSKSAFESLLKMIGYSALSKNTLRMVFSSLLSIGFIGFFLGFYFKMYAVLSLPSFVLMVLAAYIFDN